MRTDQPDLPDGLFGQRLKAARKRRGWVARELQESVARFGGELSRGTIAKIENGLRHVTLGEAYLLAAALDIPPLVLLAPVPDDGEVAITESYVVDATAAWRWFHADSPLEEDGDHRFFYNEAGMYRVSESLRWQEAQVETLRIILNMAEKGGDEGTATATREQLAVAQQELRDLRSGRVAKRFLPEELDL